MAIPTFLLLAGWPLAAQFFGPQRISRQVQDPATFSTDLLNLVLPTPYQLIAPAAATRLSREFSGLYHEATGYLGLPLLVLLIVVIVGQWDDLRVRVAGITGALMLLLSLGPWLHIGTAPLHIPLPWLALGKLPLLEHVLPGRFTVFVWLAVAVVVAVVITRATRLAPRRAAPVAAGGGRVVDPAASRPAVPGAVRDAGFLPPLGQPPHRGRRNCACRTVFRQRRRGCSDGVGR